MISTYFHPQRKIHLKSIKFPYYRTSPECTSNSVIILLHRNIISHNLNISIFLHHTHESHFDYLPRDMHNSFYREICSYFIVA